MNDNSRVHRVNELVFPEQISDFLYLIQIIILYLNNPQTDMNLIIDGVYCFISTYLFVRS